MAFFEFAIKEESKNSAVCWQSYGHYLLEYRVLHSDLIFETVNADRYIKILYKSRHILRDEYLKNRISLQHDNAFTLLL